MQRGLVVVINSVGVGEVIDGEIGTFSGWSLAGPRPADDVGCGLGLDLLERERVGLHARRRRKEASDAQATA